MFAMIMDEAHRPLVWRELPTPEPGPGQVLVDVAACAVCRTDLHVVDGELPNPKLPLVPGHEIVGWVARLGPGVTDLNIGERIGIPWLASTCGHCRFCLEGRENLCDEARFTGYHVDGGYATQTVADARFCFRIPDAYDDAHAAPLLCAGLIGHRCLKAAGAGEHLGIYGFGAAAHILAQLARREGRHLYAFTRPGDVAAQKFALSLGCEWAGGSDERPPHVLDAAIIFAPVGPLVPEALKSVRKGGTVVLGGIHMSDIPAMPYSILWGERVIRSVANLTRQDGIEFMDIAASAAIETTVETMPLSAANEALDRLRSGRLTGAAVLECVRLR